MARRGMTETREHAKALIMAGKVLIDGQPARKPGMQVVPDVSVSVKESMPYVSRGGFKLEDALEAFDVPVKGATVLDAGASTGGFTDCLLQHGARRVLAVDVGYGQFHWSLRNDERVHLLERTNVRFLEREHLPFPLDAAVIDLSFISLRLVLPQLHQLLLPVAWVVALVKPQFEAGRAHVGKGGVVRNSQIVGAVVEEIKVAATGFGFVVGGERESPIKGPKGNREFLLHLRKRSGVGAGHGHERDNAL